MRLFDKINAGEVYIIAEMSANHGGNIENAFEIVRQAAKAGADCVKIQTYTADTITINCDNEYFKIHGGLWDGYNLYNLYEDARGNGRKASKRNVTETASIFCQLRSIIPPSIFWKRSVARLIRSRALSWSISR